MSKKLGSIALAASVLWAITSLAIKGGVGVAQIIPALNFTFIGAKAEITHETANQCLNSTFISCFPEVETLWHADSYKIFANLAVYNSTQFQQALNQTILLALAPGNCSEISSFSSLPPGTWSGIIPGASFYKTGGGYETTYNFEGNILAFAQPLNETEAFPFPIFDHLDFSLNTQTNRYSPAPTYATMSLRGNANLCEIDGPMALAIAIGNSSGSPSACANIPAPRLETLDISSGVCDIGL